MSIHALPFELKDIIGAFKKFDEVISSSDTLENLSKSPVHVLLFNEILKFSKEELEAPIQIRQWEHSLEDYIFSQRHGLFFKACILKGAFVEKLAEETKWILDNIANPSNQLYETIHYMEKCRNKDIKNPTTVTFEGFMENMMGRYFYCFDTEEKKQVMDLILDKYAEKELNYFQKLVITDMPMYDSHSETHQYIGLRLNELGLASANLNGYLPILKENEYPDYVAHFNFGRYDLSKLERLLKCGFKFNDKDYYYNGDNLFIALTKSRNLKACELIFPHLTNINPEFGSFTEQHAFIDSLNKIYPKDYKFFQAHYGRLVLNLELDDKKDDNIKAKKHKL